jgi:hypothetical protein
MGDEVQRDDAVRAAAGLSVADGERAPVEPSGRESRLEAGNGKRPYSPPKLTSLGKVAELTFAKSLRASEGAQPNRTA